MYEIIDVLISEFPELQQSYREELEFWDPDTPSIGNLIDGILYPFVINELSLINNSEKLNRVFGFLEKMALSKEQIIKDALMHSVLECLGDHKELLKKSYNYMGIETRILSDMIEQFYGRL